MKNLKPKGVSKYWYAKGEGDVLHTGETSPGLVTTVPGHFEFETGDKKEVASKLSKNHKKLLKDRDPSSGFCVEKDKVVFKSVEQMEDIVDAGAKMF